MLIDDIVQHADLAFRMHIHTILPLHAALVEAICRAPRIPIELALALEDVGQGYCRMAEQVNAELVRRDELRNEPDGEESAEARVEEAVERVITGLGRIEFFDGQVVDARKAIAAHPVAVDALRAALVLGKVAGASAILDTQVVRSSEA